jgi:hypothetical protein
MKKSIFTSAIAAVIIIISSFAANAWETKSSQAFKVGEVKEVIGTLEMDPESLEVIVIYDECEEDDEYCDPDEGTLYSPLPDPGFRQGSSYQVDALCERTDGEYSYRSVYFLDEHPYVTIASTDNGVAEFYVTGQCELMFIELIPVVKKPGKPRGSRVFQGQGFVKQEIERAQSRGKK